MLSLPETLLTPFTAFDLSSSPIVAAVSGGSDSTALLVLLKSLVDTMPSSPRIVAVTVDHGLRAGSAAEAHAVGALAARLGVDHRIAKWEGDKPATGRAAAARLARYRLLADVATQIGARVVLTGHTADDQAETVAMRQKRGTGPGLAGMAPATLFENRVWIVRPLLATRREELRDVLRKRHVGWTDDQTNDDRQSERVRMRSALADDSDTSRASVSLLSMARTSSAARQKLGLRAAQLFESQASQPAPGLFHLQPTSLHDAGPESVYAFRILLAVVGGCEHLPNKDRVGALLRKLADPPHRATLSRTIVASRRDGVWLCRETRDLPQPGLAVDGAIWDGRYRLTGLVGEDWFVSAEGEDVASVYANTALPSSLARAAKAAQPVFSDRGLAPEFGWRATPILAPWATFLPSFDLAPAQAVAKLIGAPTIPAAPFADHIVTRA